MSKLKFTDGVKVDTSGPFRKIKLSDGWFVVGDDTMIPAIDESEADEMVRELSSFAPGGQHG